MIRAAFGAGVLILLLAPAAHAHDENVSSSEVEIEARRIVWRVDVGLAGLAKVVKLPVPEAAVDEAVLASLREPILSFLASGLVIRANEQPLVARPGRLEPRYEPRAGSGAPALARVAGELVYESAAPIEKLTAELRFFAALTASHRAVVKLRWDGQQRELTRLGPSELVIERGALTPSRWRTAIEFVAWGCAHIIYGYDHVAFLIALLLATTSLRELFKIVTAFTVAHSATLVLSALELVTVPSRLTELCIAASIAYVALENLGLWGRRSGGTPSHRVALTFAFGLVHGLGFATELRNRLSEMGGAVVLPVLTFNLGVELAQLALVGLLFPLLELLRRAPSEGARAARQLRLVRLGSAPILVAALYWLVDRWTA